MAQRFATVDDYIASFPEDVQAVLEQVRRTIHAAVPGAGETVRYDMPTITLDGRSVVHFAGWKRHVALYPMPAATGALADELAPYSTDKGTGRFPLGAPLPYDLIGRAAALLAEQQSDGGG